MSFSFIYNKFIALLYVYIEIHTLPFSYLSLFSLTSHVQKLFNYSLIFFSSVYMILYMQFIFFALVEVHNFTQLTENNLFRGFTTESVPNYDQKQTGKLDIYVAWNSSSCGRFLAGRSAASSTVTFTLGLILVAIFNTFCSKTFK